MGRRSHARRPVGPEAVGAVLSLPLLRTAVRTMGSALGLGWLTVPLLAVAHVPAVVALVAIWSVGCEVCRDR